MPERPDDTTDVFAQAEATFGPPMGLHGKVVSGTWLLGRREFGLEFTDGSSVRIAVEEDRDGVRLKVSMTS